MLGAPRTAFVVAANQKIVESAVDARYPELRGDSRSTGIGAQYLEKMLQLKIAMPALAVPEVVTYVNLLLAELHLLAEDFTRLREHVAAQRVTDSLGVAFDLGTMTDLGIAVPSGLSAELQWAAAIAPVLARGSRGNPGRSSGSSTRCSCGGAPPRASTRSCGLPCWASSCCWKRSIPMTSSSCSTGNSPAAARPAPSSPRPRTSPAATKPMTRPPRQPRSRASSPQAVSRRSRTGEDGAIRIEQAAIDAFIEEHRVRCPALEEHQRAGHGAAPVSALPDEQDDGHALA